MVAVLPAPLPPCLDDFLALPPEAAGALVLVLALLPELLAAALVLLLLVPVFDFVFAAAFAVALDLAAPTPVSYTHLTLPTKA